MWNSIQNGPYVRPMIPDPNGAVNINGTVKKILKPFSKMTKGNKKQYIIDVKVMNYLLQAIPNDIYKSMDACKNAKEMWERIKKLMFGSDVTSYVRHFRLMDEFEKFAAKEEESLESVYEILTTLVNIIDHNNVRPISVSINTKFLNSSKAKKVATNHDPLALIAYSNASSSQSHAHSSYSSQPYYVTHPSSVVDYEDEYQGKLQGDSQEDKLITAMMLLARAITQNFSTPTNNRHYASDCQKPRVRDAKYFREQMLLAMKDEDGSNLNNEENDFMLDTSYGEETMKELSAVVMLMARIQPADGNAKTMPSYDAKAVSELAKKAFKERENRYLEDICDLEEKLSSLDRIVYKMGQSIQTIHMLGKTPNKVYDPFLKTGLGYKNPKRLKKAIGAQQKMYDGEKLHSVNLKIDSPDSEETLEDAEETVTSELPIPKMPKESKLLKMFDTLCMAINGLRTRIDNTLLEDRQRRWISDSQNSLREFYKTDVIPMSASLSKNLKELKEEPIEEVQEMINIFESMEQKVDGRSSKEIFLENEIDQLLEV
ncbi:hypothetical protein Tco_1299982 [Tanacetum coccineum]